MSNILIVGGAGFIGSHVNRLLLEAGYHTIVLDNLSTGSKEAVLGGDFIEGDLGNRALLKKIFTTTSIQAVMHFAAFIDVGESVQRPDKYYRNNVCQTLNLLDAMVEHSVKHFIFSSTAAIFGPPQEIPIRETHPCHPISPYGKSKWMIEEILKDYDKAFGLTSICLRYFNAAGGDPKGILKNYKKVESNLIPIILRSLKKQGHPVTIFGTDYETEDGTCVRDYIHIDDLGSAHLQALEQLFQGAPSDQYNLGNGLGFSVKQVIQTAEKITGQKILTVDGKRRAGDVPFLIADSTKAHQKLGWSPVFPNLDQIIEHAWKAL